MSIFKPFKAFRPSSENATTIPALPYDVMNTEEAREIVNENPMSFLKIDRAEVNFEKGYDIYAPEVYQKAHDVLAELEENGDLIQDEAPCFYIYKQVMNSRAQVGLVGCASIDDYINNIIKKHEHTLAKKEQDRINHVNVCDANTGPIFLTYKKSAVVSNLMGEWMNSHAPVYDFVADDVNQTVWVIDDAEINKQISDEFNSVNALYIADGHHRCASAVKVGKMRREKKPNYTGDEEFNFFLAVAFPDEDLEIMDYNRVVKDLNGLSFDEFLKKIREKFEVSDLPCQTKPSEKHTFSMYFDKKWYSLKAKDGIFDENNPVSRLDVSILQNNLLSEVLNIHDPKNDERIDFVGGIRGLDELERRANSDMVLAFAMYPTTVDDLMSIADDNKIMPPKSTWFEPKLLSGLFIHHLS